MTLPAEIITCNVQFGKAYNFHGDPVGVTVRVAPDRAIVWAATGDRLEPITKEVVAAENVVGQFTLPVVDQTGFVDGNNPTQAITGWYYTASVSPQGGTAYTKRFQIVTGQTSVDLDLIGDGNVTPGVTAPSGVVTSFNGAAGAVTFDAEDIGAEPVGLSSVTLANLETKFVSAEFVFQGSGGITDDSAALLGVVTQFQAAPDGSVLHLRGKIRYAKQGGDNGAAIAIMGGNNKSIVFDEGTSAELIMDNVNGSNNGTSHGIAWLGAGDSNSVINARIRWVVYANRSTGDGIRVLGYPSDDTPAAGWTSTTGTMSNFRMVNCTVIQAPQTGAIFMGCSDPHVVDFHAIHTHADGLHFNACRRPKVNGHTAVNAGDDGLAFVTYYHATNIWQYGNGPFNQSALGQWSNYGAVADGVLIDGGNADGIRVAGSLGVTIVAPNIRNKANRGVILDSAVANGTTIDWSYHASRGVKIVSPHVDKCSIGVHVTTQNVNDAAPAAFSSFDAVISDATVTACDNWSIEVSSDLSGTAPLSGVHFTGITKASNTSSTTGGKGGVQVIGIQDSTIQDLRLTTTQSAQIGIYGYQNAWTAAMSGMINHKLNVGRITNDGGRIVLQDVRGLEATLLRSINAPGDGVTLNRVPDHHIGHVRVEYPNRANSGSTTRGLLVQKVSGQIDRYTLTHDALASAFRSLEIGGGDANDPATNGWQLSHGTYVNTINQTGNNIVVQSGTGKPVDYVYELSTFNGGAASPVVSKVRSGASTTRVQDYMGAGTPAGSVTAIPGSRYVDTTAGAAYIKATGADATGWQQLSTASAQMPQVLFKSGLYTRFNSMQTNVSAVYGSGTLRLAPVYIASTVALTRLGLEITVVGQAGSTLDLCIYSDANGVPGALVYSTAASGSASTVLGNGLIAGDTASSQEVTVNVTLTPGLYWVGALLLGATTTQPTVRVVDSTRATIGVPNSSTPPTGNGVTVGYSQSSLSAAPATFTGTSPTSIAAAVFAKAA